MLPLVGMRTVPPLFLTAASHFGAKSPVTLVQPVCYFRGLLKVRIKNLFERGKSPPQTILVQQRRCWSCGRRTP